jgi:hypothetical protein
MAASMGVVAGGTALAYRSFMNISLNGSLGHGARCLFNDEERPILALV